MTERNMLGACGGEAVRRVRLLGVDYEAGDEIPVEELTKVPQRNISALESEGFIKLYTEGAASPRRQRTRSIGEAQPKTQRKKKRKKRSAKRRGTSAEA